MSYKPFRRTLPSALFSFLQGSTGTIGPGGHGDKHLQTKMEKWSWIKKIAGSLIRVDHTDQQIVFLCDMFYGRYGSLSNFYWVFGFPINPIGMLGFVPSQNLPFRQNLHGNVCPYWLLTHKNVIRWKGIRIRILCESWRILVINLVYPFLIIYIDCKWFHWHC